MLYMDRGSREIKLEIRIDGKWTEVKESQLVDDPDDFKWEAYTED